MLVSHRAEPISISLPIKTRIGVLEKDIDKAKKKVAKVERKFLKIKKVYDDASTEVKCLRGCLEQTDRAYFTERSTLIEERNRFIKMVGEATWGTATKLKKSSKEHKNEVYELLYAALPSLLTRVSFAWLQAVDHLQTPFPCERTRTLHEVYIVVPGLLCPNIEFVKAHSPIPSCQYLGQLAKSKASLSSPPYTKQVYEPPLFKAVPNHSIPSFRPGTQQTNRTRTPFPKRKRPPPPQPPLQDLPPNPAWASRPPPAVLRTEPSAPRRTPSNIPRPHRSMGCCICCSCTLFLLFLLMAVASFLYISLVINPVMPTYKVEHFGVTALDINPKDGSVAAELAVTVRAENPNKKVGVRYKEGGWVAVAYHGVALCSGQLPALYQEPQSVAVMRVSLKGREKLEVGMAAALQRDQSTGSVPLDVTVRAPVALRVGEVDLREVVVKAVWDLEVEGLSPGKNASIKVKDYKVNLDL
ncbi:uncharacterized protein [Elaeis guineensis]